MRVSVSTTFKRSSERRDREPRALAYLALLGLSVIGPAAIYITVTR